jgi:hypothetical protein
MIRRRGSLAMAAAAASSVLVGMATTLAEHLTNR